MMAWDCWFGETWCSVWICFFSIGRLPLPLRNLLLDIVYDSSLDSSSTFLPLSVELCIFNDGNLSGDIICVVFLEVEKSGD